MFFWVSLGIFVGFAAVSALSYRREIKGELPSPKKQLPAKHHRPGQFLTGDKLVFEKAHYTLNHVVRATDGVKKILLGELDKENKIALTLFEKEEPLVHGLCDIEPDNSTNREFYEIFQLDGVSYRLDFETRMRIENPGSVFFDESETLNLKIYQVQNQHLFLMVLQGGDKQWQVRGEGIIEERLMVLPAS